VLPTNSLVRLLVTSADVIHSWAVPSLGVKIDAIPGRLNQVRRRVGLGGGGEAARERARGGGARDREMPDDGWLEQSPHGCGGVWQKYGMVMG
jgi:hypothetical protein